MWLDSSLGGIGWQMPGLASAWCPERPFVCSFGSNKVKALHHKILVTRIIDEKCKYEFLGSGKSTVVRGSDTEFL
jgi:hypothetical protein